MEYKVTELLDCIGGGSVNIESSTAVSPERIKELTMKKIQKDNGHRISMKRLVRVSLIAAIIACLLAVPAFAGLYSYIGSLDFKSYDPIRDIPFEEMGENSVKEPMNSPTGSGSFTLEEYYYDGEELSMAYSLEAMYIPPELGFDENHPMFSMLTKMPENQALVLDRLSDEDREMLYNTYMEEGKLGFIYRYYDIGDHITLSDGTDLGPMTGGEVDGRVIIAPQNGLPEAAKNRDKLEVVFNVKSYEGYIYADEGGFYYYFPGAEGESVSFTIENCTK